MKDKVKAKDRMLPVSITIGLKHLIILEEKTKSGNYSEYIRKLLEREAKEEYNNDKNET